MSEPVRVRGGSVIFHVHAASQGVLQSFDEVRKPIDGELRQERMQTAIEFHLGGEQSPEGSTVSSADERLEAAGFTFNATEVRKDLTQPL